MPAQTTYADEPDKGIAGQVDANTVRNGDVRSMFNGASTEIPFAYGVKWGSATDPRDARLPAAEADKIVGIVMHSHSYENGDNGDLGTSGVKQGGKLNVLRKGRILVVAEDGCAPGDRLWVRCTAGGAGEVVGGLTNADEGTETIDCTAQGEWVDYAAAGELAWLEVDFTNK